MYPLGYRLCIILNSLYFFSRFIIQTLIHSYLQFLKISAVDSKCTCPFRKWHFSSRDKFAKIFINCARKGSRGEWEFHKLHYIILIWNYYNARFLTATTRQIIQTNNTWNERQRSRSYEKLLCLRETSCNTLGHQFAKRVSCFQK